MCKVNGTVVKEARKAVGMSQRTLAKAVGVSNATIGHLETGYCGTSEDNVARICYLLKLNPEDIKVSVTDTALVNNSIIKGVKINGKRYFEPDEMQDFFEGARKRNDGIAETECERALETSAQLKVGNKKYVTVKVSALNIPIWQRRTDALFAREIMSDKHFDENQYDPIKVFSQDGKLFVADGVHRALGHLLNKKKFILAELLDASNGTDEIINGFLTQSIGRRGMSQNDMWRAAIETNRNKYITFRDICKKHGVQVARDLDKVENPVAKVNPTSKLLTTNPALLDFIYGTIDKLNWGKSPVGNPYSPKMVTVFSKVIAEYGVQPFVCKEFISTFGKPEVFSSKFASGKIDDLVKELTKAIGYAY